MDSICEHRQGPGGCDLVAPLGSRPPVKQPCDATYISTFIEDLVVVIATAGVSTTMSNRPLGRGLRLAGEVGRLTTVSVSRGDDMKT